MQCYTANLYRRDNIGNIRDKLTAIATAAGDSRLFVNAVGTYQAIGNKFMILRFIAMVWFLS